MTQALAAAKAELEQAGASMQRDAEMLTAEIAGKAAAIVQLNMDVASGQAALQEASARQEALTQKLADAGMAADQLRSTLAQKEQDLASSAALVKELKAELADAAAQLQGRAAEVEMLSSNLDVLQGAVAAVEGAFAAHREEADSACADLQGQLKASHTKVDQLSARNGELDAQLTASVQGRNEASNALQASQRQEQRLNQHVADLQGELAEVQLQQELEDKSGAVARLSSEAADLQDRLHSSNGALDSANITIEVQEGAADQKVAAEAAAHRQDDVIASLTGQLSDTRAARDAALTQVQADQSALSAASAAHDDLASDLHIAREEQSKAAADIAGMNRQMAAAREASSEREAALQGGMTQLQNDLEAVGQQLKDAQANYAEQATSMQSKFAAEAGKTEELSAQVASLTAAQEAAISQVAATQDELSATKQALQVSRDQEQARAAEVMQGQQALSDASLAGQKADRSSEVLRLEVQTLQAQLQQERAEAQAREQQKMGHRATALEMQRLTQENVALAERLHQMEVDVQDLVSTTDLGHGNAKQKIQYHLRLKQELEELRHQCLLALREKFQLEQCIRYLAVRLGVMSSQAEEPDYGGSTRSPLEKNPVQPASLARHPSLSTPLGRSSAMRAGRSVMAAQLGTSGQSKDEIVAAINSAVCQSADAIRTFSSDLIAAQHASSPLGRRTSMGPGPSNSPHLAPSPLGRTFTRAQPGQHARKG
ncbi:hypothetical protein WJX73_007699 [Symbiochloris irregularis]|uniref:Uncharacterized protein n=1 Tax=Symbiochloris irregularis TaxID=706552 RepID=A0AAW1NJU9_9CHLO